MGEKIAGGGIPWPARNLKVTPPRFNLGPYTLKVGP